MRTGILSALLVSALALAGCGGEGDAPEVVPAPADQRPPLPPGETGPDRVAVPGRVLITLAEQEGSGLSGTAELIPQNGATRVLVALDDPHADVAAAEVQEGDCAALEDGAAFELQQFEAGRSETIVDAELAQLLDEPYVVAVHGGAGPAACGEIEAVER